MASKIFEVILDDAASIYKEIQLEFYKNLDLEDKKLSIHENEDVKIKEIIKESIENFTFNLQEVNFLTNLQHIIKDEMKKFHDTNNYDLMQDSLLNKLHELKNIDISLDDDFKELSYKIANPFISSDDFYKYFTARKEAIANMIKSYNQTIINSLITLTPKLINELKNEQQKSDAPQQTTIDTKSIIQNDQFEKKQSTIQQVKKDETVSQSNVNFHEVIEKIRKQLYEKRCSSISNATTINVFYEVNPLTVNDFQQELLKYNISMNNSYIAGIVSQINLELGRQLVSKAKQNILKSIIMSSNGVIEFLTTQNLIQKYGINLDDKYMREIIEFVNEGIKSENQKRNGIIKTMQDKTNENDLLLKYPGYKKLYECFRELAKTESQKAAIDQIMKYGKYNNYELNTMLSNKKYNDKAEINRRINFAEIILSDEKLFNYLTNNGLNVFHGTKIDALHNILVNGLNSSIELEEKGISLQTGEEYITNEILVNKPDYKVEKRNFISLTDDFETSTRYAGFPLEEETEFFKNNYGKDLSSNRSIPIIICFNGNDIERNYGKSLVTVKSTCNEIGLNSSIDSSNIKCIITSYDKVEYVKSIVSKLGIEVLGYDRNNKFEKRFNYEKKGKFYTLKNLNIEVDEQEYEQLKEKLKENEVADKQNDINKLSNSSSISSDSGKKHLNEDLSMLYGSNIKMDLAFELIEQYNNGTYLGPITYDSLITKYNIDEAVAQRLASEINEMVKNYIQQKEQQKKNYIPYVLDGFDDETHEISRKHR